MDYWDKTWDDRIKDDGSIYMNMDKAKAICDVLWNRPHFFPMKKLEIGCGPGFHVWQMSRYAPIWGETWTGIDTSKVAVEKARNNGFDAYVNDVYEMSNNFFDPYRGEGKLIKIELFLFLDVLEHLKHHDKVAEKVKAFGAEEFTIFGNVPLYLSQHEGYERPMDITEVVKFVKMCGCKKYWHKIYGINGYPYMMFEGYKKSEDKNAEKTKDVD